MGRRKETSDRGVGVPPRAFAPPEESLSNTGLGEALSGPSTSLVVGALFIALFGYVYANHMEAVIMNANVGRGETGQLLRLADFQWKSIPLKDASAVKDEEKTLDKLMAGRMPAVLRGLPSLKKWKAFEKWTPEYLCSHVGRLTNVLSNSTGIHKFMYVETTRPMLQDAVKEVQWRAPYSVLENVTCSEFLQTVPTANENHMYFSRSLEAVSPVLLDDIVPTTLRPDSELAKIKVWLSHPNVTAHCHYDASDNLFVQVYGTKRFTLFPPEEWANLYLYPRLHPATRQSHIDIDGVNMTAYPHFAAAQKSGLQFLLHPGDMLFVPAQWFHFPEAQETLSVSVMTFRAGTYKGVVSKMSEHTLPIRYDDPAQTHVALYTYFSHLIEQVEAVRCKSDCQKSVRGGGKYTVSGVARAFVHLHLERRWSHLEGDVMLGFAGGAFLQNDGSHPTYKDRPHVTPKPGTYCTDAAMAKYFASESEKTLGYAAAAAVEMDGAPRGVRQMLLGDYMEDLLHHMVGVHHVHGFLVDCFAH